MKSFRSEVDGDDDERPNKNNKSAEGIKFKHMYADINLNLPSGSHAQLRKVLVPYSSAPVYKHVKCLRN
jgi:hypothetical protein